MTASTPTLEVEQGLFADADIVIGVDEVGRGALAGPVAVGACAITREQLASAIPEGLRDSKLLTAKRRLALAPRASDWAHASAVGWASAAEIDEFGIGSCLATAAIRALGMLWDAGVDLTRATILLDGTHDWLTPAMQHPLSTVVRAKADRDCASVAAASVIAKVARDAHMAQLLECEPDWGRYGWATNVGYGSAKHRDAIREHGPCAEHRRTWLGKIL